jgi:WD40 repeat protein
VTVSADGRLIASAGRDRTIRVWNLKTGVLKTVLSGHESAVFGVAISPDGKFLVSCSSDRTVRVWDPVSGAQKKVLKGHTTRVSDVAISPDGKLAASAGRDNTIRVWDLAAGVQKRVLSSEKALTAVRFSPDGKYLVSGGTDKTIRVWDPAAPARVIRKGRAVGMPAAYEQGTRVTAPAAGGGKVGPSFRLEKVPSSPVMQVVAGPAETVAAGFADGTVGLWSLVNGSRLEHVKLDGPIARITLEDRQLNAATERGDRVVLDLSVFYEEYCDLIRKVWKKVKVVWEDGLPVLRAPPKNHRCVSK